MIMSMFVLFCFCPLGLFFFDIKDLNSYEVAFFFIFYFLITFFFSYYLYEIYKNVLMNQKKIGKFQLFLFKTFFFIALIHALFSLCSIFVSMFLSLYLLQNSFLSFVNLALVLFMFPFFVFEIINLFEFWHNFDGKSYLAASRNGIRNEDIKNDKD